MAYGVYKHGTVIIQWQWSVGRWSRVVGIQGNIGCAMGKWRFQCAPVGNEKVASRVVCCSVGM